MARKWLNLSLPSRDGVFFPRVPTHLAHIMYCICTGCWWSICVPKPCVCGGAMSFHHVLFDCREFSAHFTTVTNSVTSLGLSLCIWSPVLQHLNLFIAVLPDGSLPVMCKMSLASPLPRLTPGDGWSSTRRKPGSSPPPPLPPPPPRTQRLRGCLDWLPPLTPV